MEDKLLADKNIMLKGPIQVSIDVTNKCNLRCLHCYNYSGENICVKNEMTDEELIKLIDDISTFQPSNVCFCGGETLLRKDLLIKLISNLSKNKIGTSIVSNGILLTSDVTKELEDAGLTQMQISIDGIGASHDRLRGKNDSFEKAVAALKNLKESSIKSNIAFSPTRWNITEFKDVVELALELNVLELRVQALMPIGRASLNSIEIIPTNNQYRELRRSILESKRMIKKLSRKLNIEWGDPIDHLIRFPQEEFNYMISIKANGEIIPSMYLPLSVGNIRKHSIVDYWNAGLNKIWTLKILKEMAYNFRSVTGMESKEYNLPVNFLEEDISWDIIDNEFQKNNL